MRSSLLLISFLILSLTGFAQKDFYSTRWSSVYKYELKDLPKSALAVVDSIYARAKKENNYTQLTRALIYQSKFAITLDAEAELKIVRNFENEIRQSKPPIRNIMESFLADFYSQYFQANRYKFYQRTRTKEKIDSLDFRTWDLATLFQEIDQHHRRSLQNPVILKQTRLAPFDDILIRGENSRRFRPTLFDLLAHHALDFYRTDESSIAQPIDRFTINDPRYIQDFENITLPQNDTTSNLFRAVLLYQQLLAFHKRDRDQSAYIDVELSRLNFIVLRGTFSNRTELHKQSLKALQTRYRELPVSTIIDLELASVLKKESITSENKTLLKEAVGICNEAIRRFPMSDGALKCKVLMESIMDPDISLTSELYIPSGKPSLLKVDYKNTANLRFRIYQLGKNQRGYFHSLRENSRRARFLDSLGAINEWSVQLKSLNDYETHSTEVVAPAFTHGDYIIRANIADGSKETQERFLAYQTFTVTDLALIATKMDRTDRFQVVNRSTGEPIIGAQLHLTNNPTNGQSDKIDMHVITGNNGFAYVDPKDNDWYNVSVTVNVGNDTLSHFESYIGNNYLSDDDDDDEEDEDIIAEAFLFTDRSIYRPAQTVFYKGILVEKKGKKTSIVPGEYVEVWMEDVNGTEYDKKRVKTNSFGSFHGEFKLPATGLTGTYSIHVDEDLESDTRFYERVEYLEHTTHTFSVEEYKRPTFEITFDPVNETYTVRDTVTVKGIAKAFSGSTISKAKFKYRVKRGTSYPQHRRYWHRPMPMQDQEIVQGEGITDGEGKFEISFAAIPDETANKESLPVFQYNVSIEVIDITGETRTLSTSVNVGYHTITSSVDFPGRINLKVKKHKVSFNTENLNGQFVPAKGTIEIFKLASSNDVVRSRPWESPDLPLLSAEEFKKLFPNEIYESSEQQSPRKEKSVFKKDFDSNRSAAFDLILDKNWTDGQYQIELRVKDQRAHESVTIHTFKVFDPSRLRVPNNELFIATTDKTEYLTGETAKLAIGSASQNITVTIDVEKDQRIVKTYVEKLSNNIKTISIPVTELKEDGFSIHYTAINLNSHIQGTLNLQVASPKTTLDIETQTFRDKIEPGVDERWSFIIKGKDSGQKEAELLASMYDASLDQFRTHAWQFDPNPREFHDDYNRSRVQQFGSNDFDVADLLPKSFYIPQQQYDRLDWFGFSTNKSDYIRVRYLERLYVLHDTVSTIKVGNDRSRKSGYIYGVVTDKDGAPIPGVNVLIKGTTIGTTTGDDGSYVLQDDRGDVIVFSFIGYNTIEANKRGNNIINAALGEDVSELSEVVVVGYGTEKMKSITGSVSIRSENIAAPTDYEYVSHRVNDRAQGIRVTGMPGGDGYLRIRGKLSIDSKHAPLYVVDGVIVEARSLEQDDLSEIVVLKDAEATAIYGSRGANGVILVTTKSGQKKIEAELAKVKARTNLNETAFFFPELRTDENGNVSFNFKTPESLTRWKLQLFAHRRDLAYGFKTLQSVTQKEFMVSPSAPRFLRTGDQITFPAKISNLSSRSQEGFINLQITDAITGKSLDSEFKNQMKNQSFKVGPKSNQEVMWKLRVPDDVLAIQYRVVASSGKYSDGEQNILPVLQNRMLVTETLPMTVRSNETKTFTLEKLKSNTSTTLKHHQVTLEVTSNPVWYAVQSLPYLMEYPHECAEQMFSRYYANTLASHVVNSNPLIKKVFDQWNSSGQLISALEKNQELKSLIIQETPWLRDAQNESEQKKRIAALFDLNLMKDQQETVLNKLEDMQMSDGGFPWFKGARDASQYITQHVVLGYGHLRKLNALSSNDKNAMIERAVGYLDSRIIEHYDWFIKSSNSRIGSFELQYLYMRSFYPEINKSEKLERVIEHYRSETEKHWMEFSLYEKGLIALVQQRTGKPGVARDIMASVKENSIMSEELGMYWKDNVAGWGWYQAPVETHSLMIEAFAEIEVADKTLTDAQRRKTLDELRVWLLKNKQTAQWKTTKATTEAVYALLLNGTDWLTEKRVEVFVGEKKIAADESSPEAGTGYFKTTWKGKDVTSSLAAVKLVKKDEGIAWGALYWQYFEDLDKITPASTPLKLNKKVFIVRNTSTGELLEPITDTSPVKVGDLLRVRIELKVDRDMEFLHMKDMRGSGLEPINVLSQYKWRDHLGYYESTKDASTNFFFDVVRTGVYVFEYDLRATTRGDFSNGITTIESMYAPEFSAHSEGIRIKIE